ncbi:MAG: prepilin-type N-terminal cleavage/methylation domain-containing protein [Candidatus Liptonbacteria bacterium]|nr:prepilin-type N-terminal cleavage/methylation domain-containing protein [Candidatus Liptonbacteria bacterium]
MINKNGFTLIEVIVYMGLFSLVVGGLLVATYTIIEGSSRLQSRVVVNEEAEFLLRKINWALTGAGAVSVPSASSLQMVKPSLPLVDNPLVFTYDTGNLLLQRGNKSATPLNSASVQVTSVAFTYNSSRKTVRVQITLANLSESQTFDVTRYLRQ